MGAGELSKQRMPQHPTRHDAPAHKLSRSVSSQLERFKTTDPFEPHESAAWRSESHHRTFSALKSQSHEPVKFGQVERFVDKRKCTVGESFFLCLREQTP